ncbi:MAG: DsrE/DsrF/DrsH-like family protein [Deltaproteobacteria bacterium]|nr:DsrE/DsrF/DrsH-like family protein [Deltaproteobacteria bacterium]
MTSAAAAVATAPKKMTICVFSGELDRLLAAFKIGTVAAVSGVEVTMYFTFWGIVALRDAAKKAKNGKTWVERMLGFMLPTGPEQLKLSQMHFMGGGRAMMAGEMKKKKYPSLRELMDMAKECGIHFTVCEPSMKLLGIQQEELMDLGIEISGVGAFVNEACHSASTLFI